ncbi:hypothetical protein A3G06_00815 [Candidatus Nomurabacteria bacterium RIFCSPLOWO2_12_FULL_46_14]|uniref:Aspartyl/glutamyl-tRNA(Asn/Gln) amidotransferase subunit C n=1 Tax=Candidatus Nomurabacteria bacterium RIFCSPLOWO2_12_FULL_46_14 TaxID=1801797 RepID=A0A1F6YA69_9BACT|nr:MAG: hypothetical protein A3G06_00815 [Candidatus Nomurabacteria bacterium RIFCSPLOWO2_12_FULL_46_14]
MEIKDVERLAELARIELTEEEKESLLRDFDSILAYVKQIEEVPINSEGNPEAEEARNVLREDEPLNRDFSKESIISQFPDSRDGFLKVKKIL